MTYGLLALIVVVALFLVFGSNVTPAVTQAPDQQPQVNVTVVAATTGDPKDEPVELVKIPTRPHVENTSATSQTEDGFSNAYDLEQEKQFTKEFVGSVFDLSVGDSLSLYRPDCEGNTVDINFKVEEITSEGAWISGLGRTDVDQFLSRAASLEYVGPYCGTGVYQWFGMSIGVQKESGKPAVFKAYIFKDSRVDGNYNLGPVSNP